jgi:hypothetical protein
MTILRHRHHPDEALIPVAKRPSDEISFADVRQLDDAPVTAPRRTLRCLPGTAARVIRDLRDADRPAVQRAIPRRGRTHLTPDGLPRSVPLRCVPIAARTLPVGEEFADLRDNIQHSIHVLLGRKFRTDAEAVRLTILHACAPIAALLAEPIQIGGDA